MKYKLRFVILPMLVVMLLIIVGGVGAQENVNPAWIINIHAVDEGLDPVASLTGKHLILPITAQYAVIEAGEIPGTLWNNGTEIVRVGPVELEETVCVELSTFVEDYDEVDGDDLPAHMEVMTLWESAYMATDAEDWSWQDVALNGEIMELAEISVECPQDVLEIEYITVEYPLVVAYWHDAGLVGSARGEYLIVPSIMTHASFTAEHGERAGMIIGMEEPMYTAETAGANDSGAWATCQNVGNADVVWGVWSKLVQMEPLTEQLSRSNSPSIPDDHSQYCVENPVFR